MTKKARINQQMGQNNQKDQKGPKMTTAVMLVQNNQDNQKIWSPHISHTILKVRFFGTPCRTLGFAEELWQPMKSLEENEHMVRCEIQISASLKISASE